MDLPARVGPEVGRRRQWPGPRGDLAAFDADHEEIKSIVVRKWVAEPPAARSLSDGSLRPSLRLRRAASVKYKVELQTQVSPLRT